MEDLKKLSVYELSMELNNIIKAKSNINIGELEILALDQMWNNVVMELWERIPSLKSDANIQPITTNIEHVLDRDAHLKTKGMKKELRKNG